MELKRSKDYDQFKMIKGNRVLSKPHIAELQRSMKRHEFTSPILISKNGYLLDGQHRLEAAKKEKLEFWYNQNDFRASDNEETKKLIVDLQGSMKWKLSDYLNFYCENKKRDYLIFRKFSKDNNINISLLLTILEKKLKFKTYPGECLSINSNSKLKQKFKSGELIFNEDQIEILNPVIQKIDDIRYFSDAYKKFANSDRFISSIVYVVTREWYDHIRFIKNLELMPGSITQCAKAQDYLNQMQDVYNYKQRNGERKFFIYKAA